MGTKELMFLFLVFIVGLFLASFSAGGIQFSQGLIDSFCAGIGKGWCSSSEDPAVALADERTAMASFRAIGCAVDAVAGGGNGKCGGEGNIIVEESWDTLTASCTPEAARTSCTTRCEERKKQGLGCGKIVKSGCVDGWINTFSCRFEVPEKGNVNCQADDTTGGVIAAPSSKTPEQACGERYPGSKPFVLSNVEYACRYTTCTVSNINLPQKVSVVSEYIRTYGDPKYLMVWQNFPAEEDTWTFQGFTKYKVIYYTTLATLVVAPPFFAARGALLAAGRAGSTAGKAWQIAKGVVSTTKGAVGGAALGLGGVAFVSFLEALDKTLCQSVLKLIPNPGQLYLKNCANIVGQKEVANQLPVMMEWRPDALKTIKNFHLASPCQIDSLKMERKEVFCKEFLKLADGTMQCTKAGRGKENAESCSLYDINKDAAEQTNEIVKSTHLPADAIEKINEIIAEVKRGNVITMENGKFSSVKFHDNNVEFKGSTSLPNGIEYILPERRGGTKFSVDGLECNWKNNAGTAEFDRQYFFVEEGMQAYLFCEKKSEKKFLEDGDTFFVTASMHKSGSIGYKIGLKHFEIPGITTMVMLHADTDGSIKAMNVQRTALLAEYISITVPLRLDNGKPEERFVAISNCNIDAVLVSDVRKSGTSPNYCFSEKGVVWAVAEHLTIPALVVSYMSGVGTIPALISNVVAGAGIASSLESGTWPTN